MQIFTDYDQGKKLNFNYLKTKPFPHIVLDNFINPAAAMQCFNELKSTNYWQTEDSNNAYMAAHQMSKWFTPWDAQSIEQLKYQVPTVHNTIQYFNSKLFLSYLEELTGIKGLMGDPGFSGGGAHKIRTGGKLSLHVDFNIHSETKRFRVLNLLLYLNPQWRKNGKVH